TSEPPREQSKVNESQEQPADSWKEPEYPAGNKPSTKWPWPTPTASTNTYKPSPTHKQLDTLQFTSEKLWEVCRNLGIAQSVGRTGVCFDNAMAESFWSTLKTEFYDRKRWATRDAARKAVAYWIEVVYNRRRRHSALGMVSPVDFENHIGLTTSRKEIAA
ncbi:integrase core domain-containing protein, partial [Corynebacterium sp. ACRPF]|uniref:integrase core domain-containing protein n=1 Tax=Corynebacterium sp. ACRPF TaxID=2918197 RepID=UPI001EF17813